MNKNIKENLKNNEAKLNWAAAERFWAGELTEAQYLEIKTANELAFKEALKHAKRLTR